MPNRIIKESICRSDEINMLSWFEEVVFYRLMVVCDDYGRFDGRAAIIKGSCFPLKDVTVKDIEKALDKLSAAGLVVHYKVEEKPYLQLATWEKHQQIRAKKSKYPAYEGTCSQLISDDIKKNHENTNVPVIQSESNPNRNRKENAHVSVDEYLAAYPVEGNRHLTEIAFISCLMTGDVKEGDLVAAAKNYAESCRILGTEKKYIKKPENFLKDMEYCQYLPGIYTPPRKPKSSKDKWSPAEQRDYDFAKLEKELVDN